MSGRSAFLVAGLLLCLVAPVRAQTSHSVAARPTRGLEVPAGAIVGTAGASSLELNPGQLGLVDHVTADFVSSSLAGDSAWSGRGHGLFLALPAGGLTLGGALQWLTPPGNAPTHVKSQIGLALGGGDSVGLGLVWNHFFASDTPGINALDSFDLGLSLRPWRFFGVGVAIRDLFVPEVGGPVALQRIYESELAVRPLGIDRLEIAGRFRIGEDRATAGYGGRLSAEIFRGVRLLGLVESLPVQGQGVGGAVTSVRDLRSTLALAFDLGHTSVTAAGFASRLDDGLVPGGDTASGGFGAIVSLGRERRQPVIPDRHIERIELKDVTTEVEFLALSLHLQRLAADPDVTGVLLDLDEMTLGLGLIEELRDQIALLRKRGKQTHAYFTSAGTRAYYLASACQHIHMQPAGTLGLNGLGAATTFFKEGLDRLGVSIDLVRVAEYKGAMEPFVRTSFSDAVAENLGTLIDATGARIADAIVAGRTGLAADKVRSLMDVGLFTAQQSKDAGLVDEITHRDQLKHLGDRTVRDLRTGPIARQAWGLPQVAVIVVPGAIIDGESEGTPFGAGETAGSLTVVKNLEEAADDGAVRAVVLRINSPGGSVSASEDIARAVKKVREAGKPVIVSMGDVAASGGYYIAAPADRIYAQPSTLTGSIGIYAFHVDAEVLMRSLGLNVETHETSARALAMNPHRPWTDDERAHMQKHIEELYDLFVDTVSQGRSKPDKKMTHEQVDKLGRGRVISGADAREASLVDETGGFQKALAVAARAGGVPTDDAGLPAVKLFANTTSPLFQVSVTPAQVQETPIAKLLSRMLGPGGKATMNMLMPLLAARPHQAMALVPWLWQPE